MAELNTITGVLNEYQRAKKYSTTNPLKLTEGSAYDTTVDNVNGALESISTASIAQAAAINANFAALNDAIASAASAGETIAPFATITRADGTNKLHLTIIGSPRLIDRTLWPSTPTAEGSQKLLLMPIYLYTNGFTLNASSAGVLKCYDPNSNTTTSANVKPSFKVNGTAANASYDLVGTCAMYWASASQLIVNVAGQNI